MKITQAILPVAGLGTRFLPLTKVVPKELLPLGSRPIIAHLVDECMAAGISDICFVISRGKEAIPQYFEPHPELERQLGVRGKSHLLEELRKYDNVRFHTVYQDEIKGDGHALLRATEWRGEDPVAVLFGDDLIVHEKTGLEQLIDAAQIVSPERDAAFLSLENIPREQTHKYGIVELDEEWTSPHERVFRVKGLVEKPMPTEAPSTLGIVGKYIIPASTFDALESIGQGSKGEIRLIDGLMKQLGDIDIFGYVFEGKRLDTGTPEGYKEAVKILG